MAIFDGLCLKREGQFWGFAIPVGMLTLVVRWSLRSIAVGGLLIGGGD